MQNFWSNLSAKQKLVYSATAMTSVGATIGGLTARRSLLGLGLGAVIGFGLWGASVVAYTAWQAKEVPADWLPLGQAAHVPEPLAAEIRARFER